MFASKVLVYSAFAFAIDCYIIDPGPTVIATKGEVWPKPNQQEKFDTYFVLRPSIFQFNVDNTCDILRDAFVRYHKIISKQSRVENRMENYPKHINHKKKWLRDGNYLGYLDNLNVSLNGECNSQAYPTNLMKEDYVLNVTQQGAQLSSDFIWGILRGLETFSQLIYFGEDASLRIKMTNIKDFPRFSYRGLMLDTSRHFIPMEKILLTLDAMVYNKFNVFHWHISDDHSFPYVSKLYPELSEKGAYQSYMVYSPSDVQEVIEYARIRGIRVLPEFDTPGHTRSWGESHRQLLTECYENGTKTGKLGPIDPTRDTNYEFLQGLFQEVGEVFSDEYIHLGGDEVGFECWESNPNITLFMKDHNITDYVALETYYIQKLINIVNELNSSTIVWEEVFRNGVTLPKETIVHVWTDYWQNVTYNVTLAGRTALLSSCWYLDHLKTGGDWQDFYNCEPYDFGGEDDQRALILGGEACMWSESVNEYNVISRVWPRASATAERLWSPINTTDVDEAARRLEEHTCRMNRRGIGAQPPNSAGYCL